LRLLSPSKQRGSVALFVLPRPLVAGDVVVEGGIEGVVTPGPHVLSGTKLAAPAYLFWLDRAYGAEFEHPSTLLLIDARSGRAIARRDLLWPPVVDGKPVIFAASNASYHARRYQLFAHVPSLRQPRHAVRRTSGAARAASGAFPQDCMIMIGNRADPTFTGSFTAMRVWAESVGLANSYAADKNALADDVKTSAARGCTDVLLYVAGHGTPPPGWTDPNTGKTYPGGPPGVELGQRFTFDARANTTLTQEMLSETDLAAILAANPTLQFKLKIDSCFSGRFKGLAAQTNLRVLEVSSAADQPSQGFLADADYVQNGKTVKWATVSDNPNRATEFTNGDVHGLIAWGRSAQEQKDHPGLAGALARSETLGLDYNGSALIPAGNPGHTDPGVTTNPALAAGGTTKPPVAAASYTCVGNQVKLFYNWNVDTVADGGTAPSFSTGGKPYCIDNIATYHWHDGKGVAKPGTIELIGTGGTLSVGPWQATGSTTYNATNDNWTVIPGKPGKPVVIDGTYTCKDSDLATWSSNKTSGGSGFCAVFAHAAQKTG
jgi:hypothetical protein